MFAKIEDGKIVFPPHNDGNHFNVHINPKWLSDHGFVDMTEEEIRDYMNSKIDHEEKPPEEKKQTVFSKLAIRRAMRHLGIEHRLNDLLNFSDTFRSDWNDAQEIDIEDPVFIEAVDNGGFISRYDIEQIKKYLEDAKMNTDFSM